MVLLQRAEMTMLNGDGTKSGQLMSRAVLVCTSKPHKANPGPLRAISPGPVDVLPFGARAGECE